MRSIFLNLSSRDLPATKAFWSTLGFEFNPKFTDDNAASMILNEHATVMHLAEPFFKNFTSRAVCDRAAASECLVAISADSRAAVDALTQAALAAGAKPAQPPQDHGFMYGTSFYDLDGHHWEVIWMDPNAAPHG